METLVVVNQNRNHQYCTRSKGYKAARFGNSYPASHFREINCRTFQSGVGVLPIPYKTCTGTPTSVSQKTHSSTIKTPAFERSSPIPIKVHTKATSFEDEVGMISENSLFSERWAGPACSNSPPPSSLPIPKFSMRPKRTVSLELPVSDDSDIKMHPIANSAPASPTREHNQSEREPFLSVDFATKALRRILNLDVVDD